MMPRDVAPLKHCANARAFPVSLIAHVRLTGGVWSSFYIEKFYARAAPACVSNHANYLYGFND